MSVPSISCRYALEIDARLAQTTGVVWSFQVAYQSDLATALHGFCVGTYIDVIQWPEGFDLSPTLNDVEEVCPCLCHFPSPGDTVRPLSHV